jgi:hypothetical protein
MASRARAQTLLRCREENRGCRSGRCSPCIDAAGLHWAATQAARERGMEG